MKRQVLKKLLSALFFVLVFALTVWAVFKGEDLGALWQYLLEINDWYLIPAIGCVVLFLMGEGFEIYMLMKPLGAPVQFSHSVLYSFIGFFYSAITPSASGGQPMQIIAMRKDGLSMAESTIALAVITIVYKSVLLVYGFAVLLFRPARVMICVAPVEGFVYLGLGLNVIVVGALLLLVFKPETVRRMVRMIFALLKKIKLIRDPEKSNTRLEGLIGRYQGASQYFKRNPLLILRVFLVAFVQRTLLFSAVWFCYKAFGLTGDHAVTVTILYGLISVMVDMLPLPGGMGISETLFLTMFTPIFGEALVLPGMVVSRGVSYYSQLLLSATMTAVSRLFIGKKKQVAQ